VDRKISLFLGFLVGIGFILLYGKYRSLEGIFESFTSLIMTFLLLVGFISVVVFGFTLLIDAFRNIRK
jgi:formate/nitrite transporter FocA (FNT family)